MSFLEVSMGSPVSQLLEGRGGEVVYLDGAVPWFLEKIQMDAWPQLGDPEPGRCEGSSCLRGALKSDWNGLPIALIPYRAVGVWTLSQRTHSAGFAGSQISISPEESRSAVKLPLKLFNLKASDKEQAFCLAHCSSALQNFPSSSFSPQDIGEKISSSTRVQAGTSCFICW